MTEDSKRKNQWVFFNELATLIGGPKISPKFQDLSLTLFGVKSSSGQLFKS